MNTYTITLKHDTGKYKIKVFAQDEDTAKKMVMKAENCPINAIVKISEKVTMYKVVKLFRVSRRRQVIERYLTEQEAQRLVQSFPSNKNHMVVYFKQFSS